MLGGGVNVTSDMTLIHSSNETGVPPKVNLRFRYCFACCVFSPSTAEAASAIPYSSSISYFAMYV